MADYAATRASQMLSAGIKRASEERGLSLRQIGKRLSYKQAVVLSHMALGRVPIPIDRAEEIAAVLEMDAAAFLTAVVEQRHPGVDWGLLNGAQQGRTGSLVTELEAILGGPLQQLSASQRRVLREASADPRAHRRWVAVHELPALEMLRDLRPIMATDGLSKADMDKVRAALG